MTILCFLISANNGAWRRTPKRSPNSGKLACSASPAIEFGRYARAITGNVSSAIASVPLREMLMTRPAIREKRSVVTRPACLAVRRHGSGTHRNSMAALCGLIAYTYRTAVLKVLRTSTATNAP